MFAHLFINQLLLRLGGAAALLVVLRFLITAPKKRRFYISDLKLVATPIQSKTDASVSNLSSDKYHEYDVIIVGGGTSGCVLAARLSEDPSVSVLLLEAGGSGAELMYSRIPSSFSRLFRSRHVYNFRTEPQPNAQGRIFFWPRAKLLGGCSSINAQMAQYGAPEDFDEWAKVIGDPSWGFKNIYKYINQFEKFHPHPTQPFVDATQRGTSGPISIGYFNTISEKADAFIKSCISVGIPFTPDFNGPKGTLGVSRIMTYISTNKERVSSETGYLTPMVLARPNLKVAIYATATSILFDVNSVAGEKRAIGVEFAKSKEPESKIRYVAKASKEVIVSGGAVHSPHILMLSGVGPSSQLKKFNIPINQDLPGVGSQLVDHPIVDLFFKDKVNNSLNYFKPKNIPDIFKMTRSLLEYSLFRKGALVTNFGEAAAFVRSDDPKLFPEVKYPEKLKDSTSGPGAPDLELFSTPLAYKDHGAIVFDVHTYALHVYLVKPTSRGNVFLKSSSPFDLPGINPNYLSTHEDVQKLVRGVHILLSIAQTKPLASYLEHTFLRADLDHGLHLKSDADITQLVKERVETVYHPTGTCRMAPREEEGVVDKDLKVYGIKGLRVCDASIFPCIISGHTAGACLAIAEKLADEIKQEWCINVASAGKK